MRSLGLDPGLASVGVALVERQRPVAPLAPAWRLVWCCTVTTSADDALEARLASLTGTLRDVLDRARQEGATVVGLEEQARAWQGHRRRGTTSHSALHVQQVAGIVRGLVLSAGLDLLVVSPQQAKAAVGAPRTGKDGVRVALPRLVAGLPARTNEHERDAVALALAASRRASSRMASPTQPAFTR